jgi:serine/threonine-protein kinase
MELPARIGKYELLEFLGGGMSHVYRGRDTLIDRPVVVKILTDASNSDADARMRFLQEARLAGNIQHENIVSVFDYGEHDGHPYIVMEYLKGEDLRNAIRGNHLGSLDGRLKIAQDIASALAYVHAQGVVHRDIKPDNLLLDDGASGAPPTLKIGDFGLARLAGDSHLTATGAAIGTPAYMSPEQAVGDPVDARSDVYSLGLVMYQMLTGSLPFRGKTNAMIVREKLSSAEGWMYASAAARYCSRENSNVTLMGMPSKIDFREKRWTLAWDKEGTQS